MLEDKDILPEEELPDKQTATWIHDKIEDLSYFGGWKILPSCTCSKCGYHSNKEKSVCPHCGSNMSI